MILVITGSRSITDQGIVNGIIGALPCRPQLTELWHGGASGVDTLAALWAEANGITAVPFRVTSKEWEADRKLAGKRRNYRMLKAAKKTGRPVQVLAIWDGVSGGTSHASAWAVALGLSTEVRTVIGAREIPEQQLRIGVVG